MTAPESLYHNTITHEIIAELKRGVAPWADLQTRVRGFVTRSIPWSS